MPYNYIEDKSEDNWLDKILAPTMNLAGNVPLSKSSTPAKPMNPIVKEALMKKIAPQRAPAAELPVVEPEMQEESTPAYDAQADFESQKVSPLAVLASGLGDAFAGRAPSREWADKLDKTAYEQTVGKSMKDAENAEKIRQYNEDSKFKSRQFDEEMKFKNRQLADTIQSRKDLLRMSMGEKLAAKNDKTKQSMLELQDRYANIKDSLKVLKNYVDEYGTQEIIGPENEQMTQLVDTIATDMAKLMDPTSVARPSEVESAKKMLFSPGFWKREDSVKSTIDSFDRLLDSRLKNAYNIRGLQMPEDVTTRMNPSAQNKPAWAK